MTRLLTLSLLASLVGCTTVSSAPTATTELSNPAKTTLNCQEGRQKNKLLLRQFSPKNTLLDSFKSTFNGYSFTDSSAPEDLKFIASLAHLTIKNFNDIKSVERKQFIDIHHVSGSLTDVIDKLSERLGLYWRIDGDLLILEPTTLFIVTSETEIPEGSLKSLIGVFLHLGAKGVQIDSANQTILLTADRLTASRIEEYLARVSYQK